MYRAPIDRRLHSAKRRIGFFYVTPHTEFSSMQILVTGAAGFIGHQLCRRILAEGHDLQTLVRTGRRDVASPHLMPHIVADLTRPLGNVLANYRPTAIIHLAARAHYLRDTAPDPLAEFRRVNRDATLSLARWAATTGVRRFVYVSSIGVNGSVTQPGAPFTESSPPAPHDPYAVSKYEAEIALQELAVRSGMELCVVRPPLVYGPDAPGNFRRLVRLLQTGLPLPFGAIRNQRSLIYVENLAEALIRCAVEPAAAGQLFLVSDRPAVSTPELLRLMARAMGTRPWLVPVPLPLMRVSLRLMGKARALEKLATSLEVDDSHIRSTLAWQPSVSMEEALARTFAPTC